MKDIKLVLSKDAQEVFEYLNKEALHSKTERMILKAVRYKSELIKQNPHYGNPVAKDLIPKGYILKYGIKNLFRVQLPNFWRMLYTLQGKSKIEIVAFVLDIFDHNRYNKLFRHRKK